MNYLANYFKNRYFIATLLLFLISVFSQFIRVTEHKENDHYVYYRTSKRLNSQEFQNIYSFKDGAFPFQYAPPTLIIFKPLSYFTEKDSRIFWIGVQSLAFLIGLILMSKILETITSINSWKIILFNFLFLSRYFLDSLYCGQVSGLMFLLFIASLFFYLIEKKETSIYFIIFNSMLKILPAAFLISFTNDQKSILKLIKSISIATLISFLLLLIALTPHIDFNSWNIFTLLFKKWFEILLSNQQYFSGDTIKSQSLRAFLLRTIGVGSKAEIIWKISLIVLTIHFILIRFRSSLVSIRDKISFFNLSIMYFLIGMPESLPYQLLTLFIPLSFIFLDYIEFKNNKSLLIMVMTIAINSIPSADLVGKKLSDGIQHLSLPFFINIILYLYFSATIVRRQNKKISAHNES